jgi:hypothetical protein
MLLKLGKAFELEVGWSSCRVASRNFATRCLIKNVTRSGLTGLLLSHKGDGDVLCKVVHLMG